MKGSTVANGAETRAGEGARTGTRGADPGRARSPPTVSCSCRARSTTRRFSSRTRARRSSRSAAPGTKRSSSPPACTCARGYDWFFPYYRDRALCLALGMTPLEMLLASVGSKDDPANAGRQMPSHWGHRQLQHSVAEQLHRHAVPARDRLRRGGPDLRTRRRHPRSRSALRHDEVTYVSVGDGATSEGEFWESLNTACVAQAAGALPRRRQRLRDLGSGRSADARRRHLARRRALPRPAGDPLRRHRLPGQPSHHARSGRARARPQGTGARPRDGRPSVLALAVGRREAVQDAGGARGRSAARSARADAQLSSSRKELATDDDLARHPRVRRARGQPGGRRSARSRRSRSRTPPRCTSSRRTSIRRRPAFATGAASPGPRRHDGRGHQSHAAGRDGRTIRASSSSARTWRTRAAKRRSRSVAGKGGVFKVTHGLQRKYGSTRVFNSPLAEANIIGRGVGMALRGLKPVVEIQFFDYIWPGVHADPRRDVDDAVPLGQPLVVPDGHPRADRRLPARRRAVSQPVGRRDLRAHAGHPDRVSVERATTPPACCARRSAATIRCCSSSTSTSTGRPTTRRRTPARTT